MQPRESVVRVDQSGRGASELAPHLTTAQGAAAMTGIGDGPGTRDPEVFLDILSHELRTPVTTIYGGAQLLATRDLTAIRQRAIVEDIRTEADRLYRLIEDLVILARSERDGLRPVGEPVALGQLVRRAIENILARHPDVRVRLLGTRDAAADGADEVLVMHVLRNLLDNAVRYGGAGEPIEVVVVGSATEVIARIVHRGEPPTRDGDPFALTRETDGTDAGRSGAGIGLFVAARLVRAMGGRIWTLPSGRDRVEFGFALHSAARRIDA